MSWRWLNILAVMLIGLVFGAQGMSIYIGSDGVDLLDKLMTPISVVVGALGLYLAIRQIVESHRQGPVSHRRKRWVAGVAIFVISMPVGAFAFDRTAAALRETRDIFELHQEVWAEPCTATEGPRLEKDRIGGEKLRFLCRYKSNSLAVEVFVTEYRSERSRELSRPGDDAQVEILARGRWAGPEGTNGTYLKFKFRGAGKARYARYWLEDLDGIVSIIASVDVYRDVSEADFVLPREALLAKRYKLE